MMEEVRHLAKEILALPYDERHMEKISQIIYSLMDDFEENEWTKWAQSIPQI